MPNARVGAMPNTTQAPAEVMNDEGGKKKPKQRRQQKGITMEDLKQQTKVRLAKEQRRREAVSANKYMHQKREQRHLEVSVSCDNSVGSSSLQSNTQHTPLYSQHSADEFPHGKFNFRKDSAPHAGSMQGKQQHHLDMPLSPNMKHKHWDQQYSSSNHSVAYSQTSRGSKSVVSNSSSSKLPHGLTVQELKEMTKARLAAEASERRDNETASHVNPIPGIYQTHSCQSMQSPTSTDQFNRHRIFSSESFSSHERQRIGSVDSFGSAQHSYSNSSYLRHRLGTSTSMDGCEQSCVDSYSYDAQDNESYMNPHGSDSFFGLERQRVNTVTSQYAANSSSMYRNPCSSEQISSPLSYSHRGGGQASRNTASNSINNDCWKNNDSVRALSPSTIPTVTQSTSSFGASSDNEQYSYFTMPKFEKAISAGAVVSNSVAESVLGPSDESGDNQTPDVFYDYKPTINLSSSLDQSNSTDRNCSSPYNFPWSLPSSDKHDENNNNDSLDITQLQSEWSKYLNIDLDGDKDDFPLSTFTSKTSTSRYVRPGSNSNNNNAGTHFYASPFQTVPEEYAFHNSNNSLSFNESVHESFLDDDDENIKGMFRRKKSRS